MPFVKQDGALIRVIDITGGFVPDPDWVADFDAAGARAAGTNTYVPDNLGFVRFSVTFADAQGQLIGPRAGSRIDVEIIALVTDDPSGVEGRGIYRVESFDNLSFENVHSTTDPIIAPTTLVFRVGQLILPPAEATAIAIAAVIG